MQTFDYQTADQEKILGPDIREGLISYNMTVSEDSDCDPIVTDKCNETI